MTKLLQIIFLKLHINLKEIKIFTFLQIIIISLLYAFQLKIGIYILIFPVIYALITHKYNNKNSEFNYNHLFYTKYKYGSERRNCLFEIEHRYSKGIVKTGRFIYLNNKYFLLLKDYDFMNDSEIYFSCEVNPYEIRYIESLDSGITIKLNLKEKEDEINFYHFFSLEKIKNMKYEKGILTLNLRFNDKSFIFPFILECYPKIKKN